jgi:drug/metabolite transporter (DMT)-like permease
VKSENKWIILLPAVLAVSWAAILIRACQAPSTAIAFYRMFFAALILLPFALTLFRKNFSDFDSKTFSITLLSGFFLGWHFFFWIASLDLTSIASSVVLVTTQPLFVAIFASIFLKERVGARGVLSIFMAIIGTILIAGFDFSLQIEYLWGDLLALLGAIMAGSYLFLGRVVRPKVGVFPYIFTVYTVAAITLGIILIFSGDIGQTYRGIDYFYFILLAAGPTLIGHSLYNYTLKHVKAHKVGVSIVAEPVLASIWAIFIFREYPNIGTIIGGAIIIAALILVFSEKG